MNALILLVLCAGLPANHLSESKLGIHLIARYTGGAQRIVAAGPRVLKVLDLGDGMRAALRDYKARFPSGKTVLRIYTRARYELKDDPAACARRFWDDVLGPPIDKLPQDERRLIDYVEGPNECESTPAWASVEEARWFGQFWAELAPLIRRHGFKPCAGSIPVGNPPGTPEEVEAKLEAFVPGLEAVKRAGGAWSYHAYTIQYTTDPAVEIWYSLRYRRFHDYFVRRHPDLASLPVILTEGGVDREGSPQTSGYRARGGVGPYAAWLAWFDRELRKDPYVLGVTLFEVGDDSGWWSFDLEPAADEVVRLLSGR